MTTAVRTTDFDQEVLKSDKPVLVDFWAEWCGPCHAVSPILERIAAEREDELKLVKVNIDEEQELAIRYGVQSIPTMIASTKNTLAVAITSACVVAVRFSGVPGVIVNQSRKPVRTEPTDMIAPNTRAIHQPYAPACDVMPTTCANAAAVANV